MQDNTIEAFAKAGKGAVKTEDGWESLDETAKRRWRRRRSTSPASWLCGMRNFKAPAVQAGEIADKTKDLTKTGDSYAGELTEEGAKSLMTFGRRGGPARALSNAKGSVKFWIKDGVISKYQTKVSGTMKNRDGDDMDIDRTTTVEIKDVGTTKITVPDEAKKKMI
jgi:hypothetical protein